MNFPRIALAAVAAWVVALPVGFVINDFLLADIYEANRAVMRSEADVTANLPLAFVFVLVGFFAPGPLIGAARSAVPHNDTVMTASAASLRDYMAYRTLIDKGYLPVKGESISVSIQSSSARLLAEGD